MGKVILLTGAPGTGKSTLRRSLASCIVGLKHFDYGDLLLRRKERQGKPLAYASLREQSSSVIAQADVLETDDWVVSEVMALRATCDIIIDSHALTCEEYGFRAIPYSARQLNAIKFDVVITLRCDPEMLTARVAANPDGRRQLSTELAREIQVLQEGLSLNYAVASGCAAFIIDTSRRNAAEVNEVAKRILKGIGISVTD